MMDLEGKKLKQFLDPNVAKAFTHPLRGHVWVMLFELGELSPAGVARELELKPEDVSYHFRELRQRGLARLDRVEKRRGYEEHIYRPVAPVLDFGDAAWMQLPVELRTVLSGELVRLISQGLVAALEEGSFDARNRHLSMNWLLVDERGWEESMDVANRALREFKAIHERCAKRRRRSSEPLISVGATMAVFETAASISTRRAGKTKSL